MTYARGLESITRVDGSAVIFAQTAPDDLLAIGAVVGLEDFHHGAEIAQTSQAVGTIVLKQTIELMAEPGNPFDLVPMLNGSTQGYGICTNYGFVGVKLHDFYVRTQALWDCYGSISSLTSSRRFSRKATQVIEGVLFDTVFD